MDFKPCSLSEESLLLLWFFSCFEKFIFLLFFLPLAGSSTPLFYIPHLHFLPSAPTVLHRFLSQFSSRSPPLIPFVSFSSLSSAPYLSLFKPLSLPLAQHPQSHPVPVYHVLFPVTYGLQVLPGVSYGEAAPLSDALVDHQLSEESWGASGRQLGRSGVALPSSHTWDFGRLQLQVHVLLECSDAGVHFDTQLIGRHPCSLQFFASLVQTQSHQTAGIRNFTLM